VEPRGGQGQTILGSLALGRVWDLSLQSNKKSPFCRSSFGVRRLGSCLSAHLWMLCRNEYSEGGRQEDSAETAPVQAVVGASWPWMWARCGQK
jgi:hypothetical protein